MSFVSVCDQTVAADDVGLCFCCPLSVYEALHLDSVHIVLSK